MKERLGALGKELLQAEKDFFVELSADGLKNVIKSLRTPTAELDRIEETKYFEALVRELYPEDSSRSIAA